MAALPVSNAQTSMRAGYTPRTLFHCGTRTRDQYASHVVRYNACCCARQAVAQAVYRQMSNQ
jgi:hypothetical protein